MEAAAFTPHHQSYHSLPPASSIVSGNMGVVGIGDDVRQPVVYIGSESDQPRPYMSTINGEGDQSRAYSSNMNSEADQPRAYSTKMNSEADQPRAYSTKMNSEADRPRAYPSSMNSEADQPRAYMNPMAHEGGQSRAYTSTEGDQNRPYQASVQAEQSYYTATPPISNAAQFQPHRQAQGQQATLPVQGATLPRPAAPYGPRHHDDNEPNTVSSECKDGRRYRLKVMQQPKRARMCGFGDKDRRPITPPPCLLLIIEDEHTGKPIDCNDIDHSMFVLNVDLWNADGDQEVNLVRHTSGSPSISTAAPYSYVHAATEAANPQHAAYTPIGRDGNYAMYQVAPYMTATHIPQYHPPPIQQMPPMPFPGSSIGSVYGNNPYNMGGTYPNGGPHPFPAMDRAASQAAPQGMFTRNLIGSLSASAFRLSDPKDHIGIWFILQDLSVRTEGSFRLRFSFVDVGKPSTNSGEQQLNLGKAPVLASCFSDVFQVYSAKKFPGVVESTALSKCFATQGIKIPIRKDGPSKRDEYDDDN